MIALILQLRTTTVKVHQAMTIVDSGKDSMYLRICETLPLMQQVQYVQCGVTQSVPTDVQPKWVVRAGCVSQRQATNGSTLARCMLLQSTRGCYRQEVLQMCIDAMVSIGDLQLMYVYRRDYNTTSSNLNPKSTELKHWPSMVSQLADVLSPLPDMLSPVGCVRGKHI